MRCTHLLALTLVLASVGKARAQDCPAFPIQPPTYSIGADAAAIVAADFNGDGHIDLATANESSDDVSVLLNNGDGTFAPQLRFPAGSRPASIDAADFNGDGHIDLATANWGTDNVSILINNGDGTFDAAASFAADRRPVSVVGTDLDGDGDVDLAIAFGAAVVLLFNHGDGTFERGSTLLASNSTSSVAAADLNGDQANDLIVSVTVGHADMHPVEIFLNNGDGTFGTFADRLYVGGFTPVSIVAADLDADGDLDLAVANRGSNNSGQSVPSVAILLNNGDATFEIEVDRGVSEFPNSIDACDLDGDGDPDLAIANSRDLSVLLNNGDGTFGGELRFAVHGVADAVVAADFNGDGACDLAVAGGNFVSVLLNDGACAPPCAADLNADGTTDVADFFLFLDLFVAGDPRADLDGDGIFSVVDYVLFLDLFVDCM